MKTPEGYIYIRIHSSYDLENACKLGKASNIPERDSTYATGELRRGHFEIVFQVPYYLMDTLERKIQKEFTHLNIKYDGGKEFYDKKIFKKTSLLSKLKFSNSLNIGIYIT